MVQCYAGRSQGEYIKGCLEGLRVCSTLISHSNMASIMEDETTLYSEGVRVDFNVWCNSETITCKSFVIV